MPEWQGMVASLAATAVRLAIRVAMPARPATTTTVRGRAPAAGLARCPMAMSRSRYAKIS